MSGPTPFFNESEHPFPKPLVEIGGRPMIEYVIHNISEFGLNVRPIFLVRKDHCKRFHLDDTIALLAPAQSIIIPVEPNTRGALCTTLLAIDKVRSDEPLVVVNFDQFFTSGFRKYVDQLFADCYEGGCLVFESVHPRWSYVRVEGDEITEVAEKRPISKRAVAGVYGFGNSGDFIDAAKRALLKDANHNGTFYISAAVNEMVLMGRKLRAVEVPFSRYHSFYSPKKVEEFDSQLRGGSHGHLST